MVDVSMKADSGGRPLKALEALVQARVRWLHETADKALDAVAVTLVRSLRAATKVAKLGKTEIESAPGLTASFSSRGGERPRPCLRWRHGARFEPGRNARVRFTQSALADSRAAGVWTFKAGFGDKAVTYYVAATSAKDARALAKKVRAARMNMYRGLARLAWSTLAYKVASKSLGGDSAGRKASGTARNATRWTKTRGGLTLEDNLLYAEDALKNGASDIDAAERKAANSIASMINARLRNRGLDERLDTPFPK